MTTITSFRDSSSAPLDYAWGSGGGSIIASMVSRGVAVSRHTASGTMRPFGQDTGTADDATALASVDNVSCASSSEEASSPSA